MPVAVRTSVKISRIFETISVRTLFQTWLLLFSGCSFQQLPTDRFGEYLLGRPIQIVTYDFGLKCDEKNWNIF